MCIYIYFFFFQHNNTNHTSKSDPWKGGPRGCVNLRASRLHWSSTAAVALKLTMSIWEPTWTTRCSANTQAPWILQEATWEKGGQVWVEDSSNIDHMTKAQSGFTHIIINKKNKFYSLPNTRRTGCRLNLSILRRKKQKHPGWPFANHNMHHPKKEKNYLHLPFLVVLNSCCSGLTLYHPLKSILHVKLTSSQKQEGVLSFVSIICSYCCLLCDVTLFQ